MNWISVKDKLPEEYEKILAHCDGVVRTMHWEGEFWCHSGTDWGLVEKDGVTHWMPLPEPPKE